MRAHGILVLVILALVSTMQATAQTTDFEDNRRGVLYLGTTAPVIDGNFSEWEGLQGSTTKTVVYGGGHVPTDAEGSFVLWSDNKKLYIHARVTDDKPNENDLPSPIAWRNDSVEVYLGINTTRHNRFLRDDSHIRLVPVSKTNTTAFKVSINDRDIANGVTAAVVYTEGGYSLEAAIPLGLLMVRSFSPNQAIRLDFQVNDADRTERDRLLHWNSPKDDTYHDPSSWGDGVVQALPQR